jgi:hypothetical protein
MPDVELAVATPRTELKTFRLAQPAVQVTSKLEVTAATSLTLAAVGIWLFVIPLELLQLVAG